MCIDFPFDYNCNQYHYDHNHYYSQHYQHDIIISEDNSNLHNILHFPGWCVATIQQHLQKTTILHIADPSSVQDMCHMNFIIDLAHHGVSMVQQLKHWNMESEGLRCDSSWGLRIFPLSTLVTRPKKISFSIINIIVI